MKALLREVRTHVISAGSEYQLTFNDPFTSDYPEFFKEGRKRRAVFRAEERRDTELVEYFAFGHPIIEAIVERVLDSRYAGSNGTLRIPEDASSNLPATEGWLFVYLLTVPGPGSMSQLLPVFVSDDSVVSIEIGQALVARATTFSQDGVSAIPIENIDFSHFNEVRAVGEGFAGEAAAALERNARNEAHGRAERERAKLEAYFSYRQIAATDRLAATAGTLRSLEENPDENVRRIIPVWQANLERDERLVQELADERARQLAQLDTLLDPVVDWELVSAGRIEITASADL